MGKENPTFLVGRNSIHISGSPTCCGILEVGQFGYRGGFTIYLPYTKNYDKVSPDTHYWYSGALCIGLETLADHFDPKTGISEIPVFTFNREGENKEKSEKDAVKFYISPATYADLVFAFVRENYTPERHYHLFWGLNALRVNSKTRRMEMDEKMRACYESWVSALEERGLAVYQLGQSRMANYPLFLASLHPNNKGMLDDACGALNRIKLFEYNQQRIEELNRKYHP